MKEDRFGHIKGPGEYSTYGFGVKIRGAAGPAEKHDYQTLEIDARAVTPTGMDPEVQISVMITNFYEKSGRATSMLAGMALKPADAEQLALALAPHLARPALVKDEFLFIQHRAPNGNWVDSIGIPGGLDNPDLHSSLEYERRLRGPGFARVVRKYVEVINL